MGYMGIVEQSHTRSHPSLKVDVSSARPGGTWKCRLNSKDKRALYEVESREHWFFGRCEVENEMVPDGFGRLLVAQDVLWTKCAGGFAKFVRQNVRDSGTEDLRIPYHWNYWISFSCSSLG